MGPERPEEIAHLDIPLLRHLLEGLAPLHGVLDIANALISEVGENDIGCHGSLLRDQPPAVSAPRHQRAGSRAYHGIRLFTPESTPGLAASPASRRTASP